MLEIHIIAHPLKNKRMELLQTMVLVKDDLELLFLDSNVTDKSHELLMTMQFQSSVQLDTASRSDSFKILSGALKLLGAESEITLKEPGKKDIKLLDLMQLATTNLEMKKS